MNIFRWLRTLLFGRMSQSQVDNALRDLLKSRPEATDYKNSVVDLMKIAKLDSSLESRKKLAWDWGYRGILDGSAEMNMFLHAELMKRIAARTLP